MQESAYHFTTNVLNAKNGRNLKKLFDRTIERFNDAERKLTDQLVDTAMYHFVYYYKGDNITRNLYQAAAPIYDLFITTMKNPLRQP